ncbi:superoxide dismutase [Actinosynnema sp. NPDC047251]|uniref:Superoxide dismutase n=1 Tax=Saccharothrix espanaensis (strain ATCC 51144 / DSM 44229 / JCM 9112 / NBRC 15066 / NRRL 15764) TaxID=1179773 RepID=K0K093_SACES|nr:superoxide dismutase [Saccharothrix espanaensis]CCH30319.1 Superoxide dismutase [Saccharothrix espanaensis DSM 44229]
MARMSGVLAAVVVGLSLVTAAPATAERAHPFPTEFALPDGFRPEGIAIGDAPTAYLGSLADGDLFRVDLRSGKGEVFSQGPGTPSVGLKVDRRGRLFVAGGAGGDARVVDARSGAILKSYKFAESGAFVNDVVITDDAAYFTDSSRAVLYKIAFGRHGKLPETFTAVPLTGDFVLTPGFNGNGIAETPDRKALLVVQSSTGQLHRVVDGVSKIVDLGGEVLTAGDGLLVRGRTLHVVQNRLNTVSVFTLDRAGTSGKLVTKITDPRFDVPTTVAAFGNRLYLPNARFTTPPTPTTAYNVIGTPNR